MDQKLEKTLGNSGPCYKCGKTMFCNETEYKGVKKLQWQDVDGKSHWLPNNAGCRGTDNAKPVPTWVNPGQAPAIDLSNFKAEHVSDVEAKLWSDIVKKCAEYTILSQKVLGEYSEIQNPALKGLVTKAAFIVLGEINNRKAKNG